MKESLNTEHVQFMSFKSTLDHGILVIKYIHVVSELWSVSTLNYALNKADMEN